MSAGQVSRRTPARRLMDHAHTLRLAADLDDWQLVRVELEQTLLALVAVEAALPPPGYKPKPHR